MTTALIADDEPALAAHLRTELARLWPELTVVGIARNGLEAAEAIAALRPDLAFLDIKMPGLTGLEVAQGIEGDTRVVFVTAYDEFAVQAFEQDAIDYLLKPINAQRLARTLARVRRATEASASPADDQRLAGALHRLLSGGLPAIGSVAPVSTSLRWVRAGHGDLTHQIDVADVLFFRADDKYTCVQTASTEHLIRTTIAELAGQLDPAEFRQVHRSTIVNLRFVTGTRRDESSRLFLRLRGHDGELPVSRVYVHLFKPM